MNALDNNNNSPDSKRWLLSKTIVEDLSHRLIAVEQRLNIGSHAERQSHVNG